MENIEYGELDNFLIGHSNLLILIFKIVASRPTASSIDVNGHSIQTRNVVCHALILTNPAHARIDLADHVLEVLSSLTDTTGARAVGTLTQLLPPSSVENQLAVETGSEFLHGRGQVIQ